MCAPKVIRFVAVAKAPLIPVAERALRAALEGRVAVPLAGAAASVEAVVEA